MNLHGRQRRVDGVVVLLDRVHREVHGAEDVLSLHQRETSGRLSEKIKVNFMKCSVFLFCLGLKELRNLAVG